MNYSKIYKALTTKQCNSSFEGYGEYHHILPRSLGGTDNESNIVRLTAREHFIAHYLLVKMYRGTSNYYKMLHAFSYDEMFWRNASSIL